MSNRAYTPIKTRNGSPSPDFNTARGAEHMNEATKYVVGRVSALAAVAIFCYAAVQITPAVLAAIGRDGTPRHAAASCGFKETGLCICRPQPPGEAEPLDTPRPRAYVSRTSETRTWRGGGRPRFRRNGSRGKVWMSGTG